MPVLLNMPEAMARLTPEEKAKSYEALKNMRDGTAQLVENYRIKKDLKAQKAENSAKLAENSAKLAENKVYLARLMALREQKLAKAEAANQK